MNKEEIDALVASKIKEALSSMQTVQFDAAVAAKELSLNGLMDAVQKRKTAQFAQRVETMKIQNALIGIDGLTAIQKAMMANEISRSRGY